MKLELAFAELHNPLFLGGTNWGVKLDVKNTTKGKVQLTYDRGEKELLVTANGKTAIIPTTNVVSMTPMPEGLTEMAKHMAETVVNPLVNPPKGIKKAINAQVSGPTDHVFAQNAGKTRD